MDLDRIDTTGMDPRLASTTVVIASDVNYPLVGAQGVAHVYRPQTAATPSEVLLLDAALTRTPT